jgi:hypothetical protein
MKLSWGTGIALAYIIFALAMIVAVLRSCDQDHSLVVDDYYAKDLDYQTQYNKIANYQQLERKMTIRYEAEARRVAVHFPEGMTGLGGEILFYNPAYKALDFRVPVQADSSGTQYIDASKLHRGRWHVKIDWQSVGKAYFTEESLVL